MHICQISPPAEFYSPQSGGAVATIIMQYAKGLLAAGHKVSILTALNADPVYDFGEVHELAPYNGGDLNFLARLKCAIGRRLSDWDWAYYGAYKNRIIKALRNLPAKPDVIIVHNDLVSPRHLKRIVPNAKVIVWLHNENATSQPSLNRTIAATDAFVCVSDHIKIWTRDRYAIPAVKLHTILNAVDAKQFSPRENLALANCAPRVLFVGRIDPNKGPDITADAVGAVQQSGIALKLTVAGGLWWYDVGNPMNNPFFRLLKQKMTAVGADYRGQVAAPDVPALIREHDIVCVLSRSSEPFGLVALEAMAGGCAVIASNRGGLPQACGNAAMLVDPDDFASVVAHLRDLATNPTLLNDMKQRGIDHASKNTWAHRVSQFQTLLQEIGSPA